MAHVAANADAISNLARWVVTGEPTSMYILPRRAPRESPWAIGCLPPSSSRGYAVPLNNSARPSARSAPSNGTTRSSRPKDAWSRPLRSLDALPRGVGSRSRPLQRDGIRRSAGGLPGRAARRHHGQAPTVAGPLAEVVAYLAGRPATGLRGPGAALYPSSGLGCSPARRSSSPVVEPTIRSGMQDVGRLTPVLEGVAAQSPWHAEAGLGDASAKRSRRGTLAPLSPRMLHPM